MSVERDGVFTTLTRHFFSGFFRLSFLDDAGEASFMRAFIGVIAAIIVFGLALARLYAKKYAMLSRSPTADLYRLMLPADQLLMIVLPMVVVIFVMAMISHSIFPDETDFRVLMALPVSRRTIFLSKATAVFLFAAVFIVLTNVMVSGPLTLLSGGRWAETPLLRRLLAQLIAGCLASSFAVAAIVGAQGLVVLLTPRRWLRRTLVIVQTVLVCEVVLSLPGVLKLPGVWPWMASHPWWLLAASPGWFLGVARVIAGNPIEYDSQLSILAGGGSLFVCAIAAASYLWLYRRFDRISLELPQRGRTSGLPRIELTWNRHPAYAAVRAFTGATLGRSGLHQLVVFGALTAGVALGLNGVVLNGGESQSLVRAATGAPLLAVIVSTLGLRGALLVPTNIRAAWIFRFTERSDCRAAQLDAVRDTLIWRGVLLPMLVSEPLQIAVLGWTRALVSVPVIVGIGWMLVELITRDWRRIPFTCTVLFGKRPAAQTFLILCVVYFVFGLIGAGMVNSAASSGTAWFVTMGLLILAALLARRQRLQTWGRFPLEFEDYLPDSVDTLRL